MNTMSPAKALLRSLRVSALLTSTCVLPMLHSTPALADSPRAWLQGSEHPSNAAANAQGVPFSPEKLASLLPATVYYQGRSAPLQIRNAAGTIFGNQATVWAALVDTSGYSTSVQERYQFYLVTEGGLRFGDVHLPAGAYGAGFVGERFVLMDLGGHPLGDGATQTDPNLRRPRPLQMVANGPSSVKLYLGRRWILLQADTSPSQAR